MSRAENGNTHARKSERLADGSAEPPTGAQAVMEDVLRNKQHKSTRLIPFKGLLANSLLTALPGEDFARLLPFLEPVSLASGQKLNQLGEAIDFAYFPETAVISHVYFLADGSTTAAAIVGREGLIGLSAIFASPRPSYWTQVLISGSALRIGSEILKQEFARAGAMQQLLLGYTSERLAQLSRKAVCNGRHTVGERLCTWLLMIRDRVNEDRLSLTHEEIARHLGARRAGITGCCHALRDAGIVNYHRGMIHILDRQRLERAACECYPTLRQAARQPQAQR
jgi:CRP-like cAMP-binding protein